jgi:hypothetical protein
MMQLFAIDFVCLEMILGNLSCHLITWFLLAGRGSPKHEVYWLYALSTQLCFITELLSFSLYFTFSLLIVPSLSRRVYVVCQVVSKGRMQK